MSDFQWVKFEENRQRFDDRITITKSGGIGFPKKFSQDHGIKTFGYVLLFYDPNKLAIGVAFTNNDEKGKLKISHSKDSYGSNVNARTFFFVNNIDFKTYSGKYIWKKDIFQDKELFVITLVQSVEPSVKTPENQTGSDASQEAGA